MDRGAIAIWEPNHIRSAAIETDSGARIAMPQSSAARFELGAPPSATTPEELLAAAYAGCFTMTFAEQLTASGYSASRLHTEVRVQLVRPGGHWEIPSIRIHCSAIVPGIEEHEFLAIAHAARNGGPIAQALRAEITLTVSLDPGGLVASRGWHVPEQGPGDIAPVAR
jgi:osmotically inducible protein OsmC